MMTILLFVIVVLLIAILGKTRYRRPPDPFFSRDPCLWLFSISCGVLLIEILSWVRA